MTVFSKPFNGGENWFFQSSSLGSRILSMSIDPENSNTVYASLFPGGVLKTLNGGGNWFVTGLQDFEVINTAVNPENPTLLYSGTNGNGLFRSLDRGSTWNLSQIGLHATQVSTLLAGTKDQQRLIAGVYGGGVQQTFDGGESWFHLGANLSNGKIAGLVTNPANPNLVFALTETAGLYRCNLIGACWLHIDIDFPSDFLPSAAFDLDHPFGHISFLESQMQENTRDFLAVSGSPALLSLVFAPSDPQIAYLGSSGTGIYKSIDNGVTWQPSGLAHKKIVSIAIHPQNSGSIFAAAPDQIFRSNNGGASWGNLGLTGLEIYAVALDSNANLYAGTSDGIYRYAANGWSPLALQGLEVTTIANSHQIRSSRLYAGTTDGLFISHNAGQTWDFGPEQLTGLTVQSVSFDPADPAIVFVSTTTHGVLRFVDID